MLSGTAKPGSVGAGRIDWSASRKRGDWYDPNTTRSTPASSVGSSGRVRSENCTGFAPVCSCSTSPARSLTLKALCGSANRTTAGTNGTTSRACSSHAVPLIVVNAEAATIRCGATATVAIACASPAQYASPDCRQAPNAGSAATGAPGGILHRVGDHERVPPLLIEHGIRLRVNRIRRRIVDHLIDRNALLAIESDQENAIPQRGRVDGGGKPDLNTGSQAEAIGLVQDRDLLTGRVLRIAVRHRQVEVNSGPLQRVEGRQGVGGKRAGRRRQRIEQHRRRRQRQARQQNEGK